MDRRSPPRLDRGRAEAGPAGRRPPIPGSRSQRSCWKGPRRFLDLGRLAGTDPILVSQLRILGYHLPWRFDRETVGSTCLQQAARPFAKGPMVNFTFPRLRNPLILVSKRVYPVGGTNRIEPWTPLPGFKQARDRGCAFLLRHQGIRGEFPRGRPALDDYYKALTAFQVCGHNDAANRLCQWIRIRGMTPEGDFGPRKEGVLRLLLRLFQRLGHPGSTAAGTARPGHAG